MLIYGTVKYIDDESTSIVDSKAFHATEDDIYPTLTVCLEIDTQMKKWHEPGHMLPLYNEKLHPNERRDYVSFLLGNNTKGIDKLMDVNYDETTFDLNDYIERVEIKSGDKILYVWGLKGRQSKSKQLFVSYRHPLLKCFSMDISNAVPDAARKGTAISSFDIQFGKMNPIFNEKSELIMSYFLHYPNQLMRSTALERDSLGITSNNFLKIFSIDNMEVIRKSNARFSQCNENYKEEDDLIRKRLIKQAGCTPIHWPIDEDYKDRCKTADEMIQVGTPLLESINPKFLNTFKDEEPCNQIYAIAYTFKDLHPPTMCDKLTQATDTKEKGGHQGNTHDNTSRKPEVRDEQDNITKADEPEIPKMCISPPTKGIVVGFKSFNYKEIKHIKDFTIESWVGNVGGYIGLFLGCAIWEVPNFIEFLFRKLKRMVDTNAGLRKKTSPFVYANKN
jgi:hypothetical protein